MGFTCIPGDACVVSPIRGFHLSDGHVLRYTNLTACAVGNGSHDELGATSSLAEHCGEYFVGCTISWSADMMLIPSGRYRLCWCNSANYSRASFLVDIGTLAISSMLM